MTFGAPTSRGSLPDGWTTPPEGRHDFDATHWLDQIQSAHYQTLIFYTKFHDGHCTYPSRYSDYCTDQDYFGECTLEARKRGMRILAYYSSILDQNIGSKHPEWQVRGRDGQPAQTWATIRWPDAYCCINHPEYKSFMLGQISELCENYQPDGIWMDVFEPLTTDICFCPSCQAKYNQETNDWFLVRYPRHELVPILLYLLVGRNQDHDPWDPTQLCPWPKYRGSGTRNMIPSTTSIRVRLSPLHLFRYTAGP